MAMQRAAAALYASFVPASRDTGATFYHLLDGSPEWMTDAVRAAHNAVDEMPDDEVYACAMNAAGWLASGNDPENACEFADGEVSVYNAARVAWLAAKPLIRGAFCDEAAENMGASFDGSAWDKGIYAYIALGWYEWASAIYHAIHKACEDAAERAENGEGED